jgi:rSAM/selenodomain-associated transferase 2
VESPADTPEPLPAISIIIPTLDEEAALGTTLDALSRLRGAVEVIVVDGGSRDGTVALARARGVAVLASARGRGVQMHAGARAARGVVLWFLHADTLAPADAVEHITRALRTPGVVGGHFRLRLDGTSWPDRFMTALQPLFAWLGLVYGDSAIFVRRQEYERVGGFKPFPLFEDLDFVRRLQRRGRMVRLAADVVTSSRRFEGRNFPLTFARWVGLQLLYWLGVSPHALIGLYPPVRGN